ncbi:sensory protein [Rhodanobacter sp. FW510-R12]|uniref:TspO/MBR family protein n=1 Tax=unclassified Rhodanobacter TaxID=2621553 RepID=UPI0007AA1F6B|nr:MULTISPECIES: TspO/MBR family protein [unclassified Rhodanobacter]KZC16893.1 sensory protein [Rhodanobacter sp. FW104-R8]KZC27242.1 sensory protein [Rhodanobacter sp. FW510-T8]KZC31679.1 sensory protein [Rhodanobacter sp. FW510-R10]
MSGMKQIVGVIGWLLLSFAAAATGAMASVQAATFYRRLAQPSWAPPASVFGPVWSVLYVLMGMAAWLVWRNGGWRRQHGVLALFVIQLMANALWSWLFFGWHRGALAFADIVLLWLLIVATAIGFWRVRPLAGALLLPYLGWVGFAMALNYAVWHLNPSTLG